MCREPECCCHEEEMTLDELIDSVIEDIKDGDCLGCSLKAMFELGYFEGRKSVAELFSEISEDILDEDFDDEE